MGFSQGDFIQSEKVELKESYTKWNEFFYSKDHTCRLLIPKIIVKVKIFLQNFEDRNSSQKCFCMLGSKI